MIYLVCGLIIGIVMGLTGAGGALVAIPLFMQFLGQSLKEASLYSLVAVVLASLMNFVAQRSYTKYKVGFVLVTSSIIGSFLTAPLKEILSSLWIAGILSVVSVYALFSVWVPFKSKGVESQKPKDGFGLSVTVGFCLGVLTTLTGLGGGVLMLPVFLGLYRFSRSEAVATSLFAVGLSSLGSLFIQIYKGTNLGIDIGLIYLVMGIIVSAFSLKRFSSLLNEATHLRLQQVVFTVVVFLALSKVLF